MNKVKFKTWTKTVVSEGTSNREDAIATIFCGCDTKAERDLILARLSEIDVKMTEYSAQRGE